MEAVGVAGAFGSPLLRGLRSRVDGALRAELAAARAALEELDPRAGFLAEELERLVAAGGKRLRPTFCYLGYRAAGGAEGEAIVRASAALELLHTFALVHDDVMDEAAQRRGVETTHERTARLLGSPARGRSAAILVGDLAAVLAESLLRHSGFPAPALERALERFDRMRLAMAAGQYLDVAGAATDLAAAEHVARLKTAAYTAEGPLRIGAALAGAPAPLEEALGAYGRAVGEAFQLRDDLADGCAAPGALERAGSLLEEGLAALDGSGGEPEAIGVLRALAEALRPAGG